MKLAAVALSVLMPLFAHADSDWRTSWDGTLYGYANDLALRGDSVLNPNNQVARLAQRSEVVELRFNLKAENETLRFSARGISSARATHNNFAAQQRGETYLSQWQVRARASEDWTVAAGREVLNWGAAQFRSPSSPFYFDNGRNDPMRELVGMDALKVTWTPDRQLSVNLARIVRSGYGTAQPDVWRDGWLAKFDQRGDEWAYGIVLAKSAQHAAFYGAYGQLTVSDALLCYTELGSFARDAALLSPAEMTQPFSLQAISPRRTSALIGAAYTLDNGHTFSAEYLHEDHGFNRAQEIAYFQRARTLPGMALAYAPRLLGRDYLHLVWQSNLLESEGYWRAMFTRNLTDGSSELGAYAEKSLTPHLSAFSTVLWNVGNTQQELSALFTRSLTVGIKVAMP